MNSLTPTVLESLSYWVRLDDLVPIPDIENRLTDHARRGLLLRQANEDPTDWIEQSELLLRDVDFELRRVGAGAPALIAVGASAPAVETLRSMLAEVSEPRRPAPSKAISTV